MIRQLGLTKTRLLAAIVLVIAAVFAGYNAYRLYYVKPVFWVNGIGFPLASVTPSLERAVNLVQRDIPDVSSSMQEPITARRWQVGLLALLCGGLLGGAILAVRG